jgi:hypothetical protein
MTKEFTEVFVFPIDVACRRCECNRTVDASMADDGGYNIRDESIMQDWKDRLKSFLGSDGEWAGYTYMTTWNDLLPVIVEAAKRHALVMTFLGTHAREGAFGSNPHASLGKRP